MENANAIEGRFERPFDGGDAKHLASLFTAGADLRTIAGGVFTGRAAVEGFFRAGLEGPYRVARVMLVREHSRWLSCGLILADGCWRIVRSTLPARYPDRGDYTQLVVREGEAWRIAALRFSVPRDGHTRHHGRDRRCR